MKHKKIVTIFIMMVYVVVGAFGPPLYMKVASEMDMLSVVIQFLLCGGICTLIFQHAVEFKFTRTIKRQINVKILLCILSMCITYAMAYSFFIIAMKESSATETTMLTKLTPLFTAIFSIIFLKEKIKSKIGIVLAIILSCMGVVVFLDIDITNLAHVNRWLFFGGITIALLYGIQATVSGYLDNKDILSKGHNTAIGMIGGAILLWLFCIFTKHVIIVPSTIYDFGWIVVLGLTVSIPTYLKLVAYGLGNKMTELAFYDYLSPLVVAIIAYIILGEKGFKYELLGIGFALIIAGIYILSKSVDESKPKKTLNQGI